MKLRGPVILTLVLAGGQLLGLFRTFLVARILGTEIQGEAIAIGLLMGLVLCMLSMNNAWQLVQSRTRDLDGLQDTLQGMGLLTGLIGSITLLVAGSFLLEYIGQRQLLLPLYVISLNPFIEGFTSLDPWRELREKRYRSLAFFQMAGPIGGTLTAIIALSLTQSIWTVVIIAGGTSISRVVASHFVAKRKWRPSIRREHMRPVFRFWLPLVPAGLLFWINSKSDQILMFIGARTDWLPEFSIEEIGAYGTVAGLILLPRGTIVTAMKSVLIPNLAEVRSDSVRLRRQTRKSVAALTALAIVILLTGMLVGDAVFTVGLGRDYAAGARVAPILITALSIQLFRTYCYESSVAMGQTSVQLVGNLFRLSSMGFAIVFLMNGQGIAGLASSVLWGEIISTIAAVAWLIFTGQRESWVVLPATLLTVAILFLCLPLLNLIQEVSPEHRLTTAAVVFVLLLATFLVVLRRRLLTIFR